MDNKCSHPPKTAVNLKQLPPIDPLRIVNSSFKLNSNSSSRSAAKVVKPSSNHQRMKLVDSDEGGIVKNPTLKNVAVEDASSISANKGSKTCSNRTTPTQTYSADEGMKKGSGRSNLYEICAANHWKPPVFECCKEEGPSHRRMFTFKVIVEIDDALENIIECYGTPHQKKKTAADHAAEVMLSRLGCQCSEEHAFLGEPLNPFPVNSLFLFLVGVSLSQRRRRVPWRKHLKLPYCAYWYYIELLSKLKHCVWFNNCPWLLEHIGIRDTTSWVAAHNLSCSHRSVMELNTTMRMDNPEKHGL